MNAIEAQGIGKRYAKFDDEAILLRSVLPFKRPKRTELWVLRNISFSVGSGETVGVLGRNGAGKSTLLRLLAGVSAPTEGRLRVRGRIAPLLSVGVGFHEEMSGRENIFVNGLLLGLSQDEVRERFDRIVEFAELEEFIDTPVKFYSSGMFMRLGFSVAIHVEPDVLLADEILAVGDAAFQLKCFEKMRELQRRGTTILFVSHSVGAIRLMCERGIVLHEGTVEYDGDAETAISRHHALLSQHQEAMAGGVEIVDWRLVGEQGETHHASYDEPMEVIARLRFVERVEDPHFGLGLFTATGVFVVADVTARGDRWRTFEAGEEIDLHIPFRARLGGGTYELQLAVREKTGQQLLGEVKGLRLYVAPRPGVRGIADLCTRFVVNGHERARDDAPAL